MGDTPSAPVNAPAKEDSAVVVAVNTLEASVPVLRTMQAVKRKAPSDCEDGEDISSSSSSSSSAASVSASQVKKEEKKEEPPKKEDLAARRQDEPDVPKCRRASQIGPFRDGYILISAPARVKGTCRTCGSEFTYVPWKADYAWIKAENPADGEVEAVRCIHRTCPGHHYND